MLRVALAELKLQPSAFWALTPYEFMTMTGALLQMPPWSARGLRL